ncbi:hypothetical protein D9M71_392680 [compost metagenome]
MDRAEQADSEAELLDELQRKRGLVGVTKARLRELEAAAAARDALPQAERFLPPYVAPEQRPALGEIRVVGRNALGQISKLAGDGVVLRVSARREGRIQSVSVTPEGGEPFRLCVKRDELGRLVAIYPEDR